MLSPRRYKYPLSRSVTVGGVELVVRALSQSQIHEAESEALSYAAGASDSMVHLERLCQIVSVATGISIDSARCLTVSQLFRIVSVWSEVQSDSVPDLQRLDAAIRLAVMDDPETSADGAIAHASESAADYYGRPTSEITLGQLCYWTVLRNAFRELRVEQGGKKVSRAWLQRQLGE